MYKPSQYILNSSPAIEKESKDYKEALSKINMSSQNKNQSTKQINKQLKNINQVNQNIHQINASILQKQESKMQQMTQSYMALQEEFQRQQVIAYNREKSHFQMLEAIRREELAKRRKQVNSREWDQKNIELLDMFETMVRGVKGDEGGGANDKPYKQQLSQFQDKLTRKNKQDHNDYFDIPPIQNKDRNHIHNLNVSPATVQNNAEIDDYYNQDEELLKYQLNQNSNQNHHRRSNSDAHQAERRRRRRMGEDGPVNMQQFSDNAQTQILPNNNHNVTQPYIHGSYTEKKQQHNLQYKSPQQNNQTQFDLIEPQNIPYQRDDQNDKTYTDYIQKNAHNNVMKRQMKDIDQIGNNLEAEAVMREEQTLFEQRAREYEAHLKKQLKNEYERRVKLEILKKNVQENDFLQEQNKNTHMYDKIKGQNILLDQMVKTIDEQQEAEHRKKQQELDRLAQENIKLKHKQLSLDEQIDNYKHLKNKLYQLKKPQIMRQKYMQQQQQQQINPMMVPPMFNGGLPMQGAMPIGGVGGFPGMPMGGGLQGGMPLGGGMPYGAAYMNPMGFGGGKPPILPNIMTGSQSGDINNIMRNFMESNQNTMKQNNLNLKSTGQQMMDNIKANLNTNNSNLLQSAIPNFQSAVQAQNQIVIDSNANNLMQQGINQRINGDQSNQDQNQLQQNVNIIPPVKQMSKNQHIPEKTV